MTSRLKVFAAAALGLLLATGTLADASAKTVTSAHKIHQMHGTKTVATAKAHRLHIAHRHHAPKLFVSRHLKGHRVVTNHVAPKTTKEAGATVHRERHAMTHTAPSKTTTVVR